MRGCRWFIAFMCLAALYGIINAQTKWLHIYQHNDKKTTVNSAQIKDIRDVRYVMDDDDPDVFNSMILTTYDGEEQEILLDSISRCVIGSNIPSIYLNTTDTTLQEIPSKDYYVDGYMTMKGYGTTDDVDSTFVNIKGRGNSTWKNYPKKPYRLKFSKKISLCGLKKSKSYALIANYIDCTLMRNAVAFKIAQLLEMPYANHSIPVNLYLNGRYRGSYMLTEKIGINSGSVDIDETRGVLFELDNNYDEKYKFLSKIFKLPVMVKDPDIDELAESLDTIPSDTIPSDTIPSDTIPSDTIPSDTIPSDTIPSDTIPADSISASVLRKVSSVITDSIFNVWREDFERFESTLAADSDEDFFDYIDVPSLIDYFIVNNMARNSEVSGPKSVFMYKDSIGGKYKMGPVWDFDWAYTWQGDEGSGSPTMYLLYEYDTGGEFFIRMLSDERVQNLYDERLHYFRDELFPLLMDYIDEYADMIEASAAANGELWQEVGNGKPASTATFRANVEALKEWLVKRLEYIDEVVGHGLYYTE